MRARNLVVMAAVVGACVVTMTSCRGVDQESYVAANKALLAGIPTFPEARPGRVSSTPYKRWGDVPWAPIAPVRGFTTHRSFMLPRGVERRRVIAFYRRLLADWTVIDASPHYLNFRQGDAYVHLLAGEDRVTLSLDHEYCKPGWPRRGC